MKKVLIIANLFHASPRIPGLTSYLPEFGWEATIITPPLGEDFQKQFAPSQNFFKNGKIVEVPYRGDIFWFWRKLFKFLGFNINESILNQTKEKVGITSKKSFIDYIFNLYQTIFGYPDNEKGWKRPAVKVGCKLLKKEKFDAIISSSSPVTAHIIVNQLKKKFHLPWIADFRDFWTQNYNYPYPWWRRIFEKRLEVKTLFLADVLTTAFRFGAERFQNLHKRKKVHPIVNGFDPEKINNFPLGLTSKFTITYTGQIYTEKQDISKLFFALKNLISNGKIDSKDIKVRFFGRKENWLNKEIENFRLISVVKQYGIVPRETALKKQWESQILLLLNWEDPKVKGCYTGKIFEYLAAQRPVLVTGGFGSDALKKLINETQAGVYCPKIKDIENYLCQFYLEYKQKRRVEYKGNWEEIKKYSHREMSKKFANILNRIT